jgi:ABC-2 type transport system permease protein
MTAMTARAATMNSVRIFFRGGLTSYRALFNWITPWILIPTFIIEPVFQVLFFVFVGRTAGVGNDRFFLIGNAIQFASIPCLFAMSNTISDERNSQTLALILVTPARRLPLFLGRALPVIVNGFAVSLFTVGFGALVLRVRLPGHALMPLVGVLLVAAFACTGLGLVTAAIALRVRETAVLANIVFGVLLIFCGVNVPLQALPKWMAATAHWLPLTHGIAAARALASGSSWDQVSGAVAREAGIGAGYVVAGMALLYYFEAESRRRATLETA